MTDIFYANIPKTWSPEILNAIEKSVEDTYEVSVSFADRDDFKIMTLVGSKEFTKERILRIGMHIGLEIAKTVHNPKKD